MREREMINSRAITCMHVILAFVYKSKGGERNEMNASMSIKCS